MATVFRALVKAYEAREAVKDVAFEVGEGEIFALLGPTVRERPRSSRSSRAFASATAGTSRFSDSTGDGRPVGNCENESALFCKSWRLSRSCQSAKRLLETPVLSNPRSVEEVIELIGLAEKADDRVKSLSGGSSGASTSGLESSVTHACYFSMNDHGFDPSARRGAWDVVRALTGGGTTVVLTTHYMDEAEALADRVAVLNAGRIVAEGTQVPSGP